MRVVGRPDGNPDLDRDIADGLLAIVDRLGRPPEFKDWGVYHLGGRGEASWADFAREIFRVSAARGGPSARVRPIPAADYPTRARRPANSRLNGERFSATFDFVPRTWQEEVAATVAALDRRDAP